MPLTQAARRERGGLVQAAPGREEAEARPRKKRPGKSKFRRELDTELNITRSKFPTRVEWGRNPQNKPKGVGGLYRVHRGPPSAQ